jgi:AraC-like DNA-binding protein
MDADAKGVPSSTYREFAPPAALASHVLCVWAQVIGDGGSVHPHRVLPDGCADVVWIGEAPPVVAGPATGPVVVPLAPRTLVVGIRLRPGAVHGALGAPASELANRDTPLDDIWGAAAGPFAVRVVDQSSLPARLAAAEAALALRIANADPPDPLIIAATQWLARHPEGRIEDLARLMDVGARRLRRRFAAAVGYGPKTFQRVLRLQRALTLAGGNARPRASLSLAMIAAEAGYADQAHMSRELRALTGRSPGALLPGCGSTLELSDLFKTAAPPRAKKLRDSGIRGQVPC